MTTEAAQAASRDRVRRTRTRRGFLLVVAILGIMVAVAIGGAAYLATSVTQSLERIPNPFPDMETRPPVNPADAGAPGQPLNILLLGSDSRVSAGDPSQWRYGAQRTDAIILLHITGDRSGAFVVSIPRDSWVHVPGYGMAKVNAAFSYGGPPLLIRTLERLTDVRIDHFAVADFDSFVEITDALGGVTISVPHDTYAYGKVVVKKGTRLMNGTEALAYASQRYGLPGGDFDRIKRQQNWMRAMAQAAVSGGSLTDPVRAHNLLATISRSVAVDEGLSLKDMAVLAVQMRGLGPDDAVFLTIPVLGTGWSPDGKQSIVQLDADAAATLFEAIRSDTMSNFVEQRMDELDLLGSTVR